MAIDDQACVELRKHLDRHAVGFPKTKSGAEIRFLKHMSTPFEAEIATCLGYKPGPVETVFSRSQQLVESSGKLIADSIRTGRSGFKKIKEGNSPLLSSYHSAIFF